MSILTVQRDLKAAGFDPGPLDGEWGPRTRDALQSALATAQGKTLGAERSLAWGRKVDAAFRSRVFEIGRVLQLDPDYLMSCMAFETGESFSPSVRNGAGSGATGLIQFMPATARALGTTTDALARMTALQQLDYVESYFRPYRGRLRTLSDVYMAILWPAAIGRPESSTLWSRGTRPETYRQNAGLDGNRDSVITKAEAAAKVAAKLAKGMSKGLLWMA